MAKQRFAICELGPRWSFLSPLHGACEQHKPIDIPATESRRLWLRLELQTKEKS